MEISEKNIKKTLELRRDGSTNEIKCRLTGESGRERALVKSLSIEQDIVTVSSVEYLLEAI